MGLPGLFASGLLYALFLAVFGFDLGHGVDLGHGTDLRHGVETGHAAHLEHDFAAAGEAQHSHLLPWNPVIVATFLGGLEGGWACWGPASSAWGHRHQRGRGDSGGAGASRITQDIANIIAQVPAAVEALTGVDLVETIRNLPGVKKSTPGSKKGLPPAGLFAGGSAPGTPAGGVAHPPDPLRKSPHDRRGQSVPVARPACGEHSSSSCIPPGG